MRWYSTLYTATHLHTTSNTGNTEVTKLKPAGSTLLSLWGCAWPLPVTTRHYRWDSDEDYDDDGVNEDYDEKYGDHYASR